MSCAQRRTVELPGRGQQNCPVVAGCSARGSFDQGRDPLTGLLQGVCNRGWS